MTEPPRSLDGLQSLDAFLDEEGIREEVTARAIKRIGAFLASPDVVLSDLDLRVFGELCERGFLAPDDGVVREVCERLVSLNVAVHQPNPLGGEPRYAPAPGWDEDREEEGARGL